MTGGEDQGEQSGKTDPEAGWPPRFDASFVGWSALVLLAVFVSVSGWFRTVWDAAGLFKGARAPQHTLAYVLVIVGLLCILAGLLFALIESKAPPARGHGQQEAVRNLATVNPISMVADTVDTLSSAKRSTALLAIGLVLLVLAAAGAGMISISVGDPSTAEPSPAASPTG